MHCLSLTDIVLPEGVTSIGKSAFSDCDALTSIVIPDAVTEVGPYLFSTCETLSSVTLGSGLTYLSDHMFDSCRALESIYLPDNITSIGELTFQACRNLQDINFPEHLTSIGRGAFSLCLLDHVELPASVTEIGENAFFQMYSIRYYYVSPDNPAYSSPNGALCSKDGTIAYFLPCRISGPYVVPEGVVRINAYAMWFLSTITDISIPASVRSIGERGITGMKIDTITFLGAPPEDYAENGIYGYYNTCIYYMEEFAEEWAPNGETEWNGIPIRMIAQPANPIAGDVDGDGHVSFTDITMLYIYIMGTGEIPEELLANADVNGDGCINYADITAMYMSILA